MPEKHDRDTERRQARRAVEEAGGGFAEGFELAEKALRDQAENIDKGRNPKYDAGLPEAGPPQGIYGDADHERSTELRDEDG